MATTNHILRFDRPLADVYCEQARGPRYTAADVARIKTEAFEKGQEAQRAFTDARLHEFRAEVAELQRGLFSRLERIESEMYQQLHDGLPDLVIDLAKRLLAGFEPTAEQVRAICESALGELMPARDGLELVVAERDAAILAEVEESWQIHWPGLRIRIDRSLRSGECVVHSRFGLVDGRHQPRLEALREELGHGGAR